MKGSLIIVTFFALGIVFALFSASNAGLAEFTHLVTHSSFSYYALCALMFCVGISIGCDAEILRSFKRVNPRLMLLPVMTIVGTLAGTTAASALLADRQLTDCLAIGSGFGYYSLSSIFITEMRGPELGTIALLANIMREILTLLLAPEPLARLMSWSPSSMASVSISPSPSSSPSSAHYNPPSLTSGSLSLVHSSVPLLLPEYGK